MSDPQYEDIPTDALLAIQSGRKLTAVKILREQTGMGLTEAKSLVDRVSRDVGKKTPRMAAGKEDSGLLRLLVIVAVLGAVLAAFYLS